MYSRILKISWKLKVTNQEILWRMNKEPQLIRPAYKNHSVRHHKMSETTASRPCNEKFIRYGLLQEILQGKLNRRRRPGWTRISWLANLRTWFGKTSAKPFRIANDKVTIAIPIANFWNGRHPEKNTIKKKQEEKEKRKYYK